MSAPRRNTWQREAVRARLAEAQGFVSAQQLYAVLRDEGSTIGLATVYRNLAQLAESGEADSLQSPEGENLFRSCSTGHHHHLICRRCGLAVEVSGPGVERWAARIAEENGFVDVTHSIELFGLCASCAAASA